MNTSSVSFHNDSLIPWKLIPLLTPAVKEDSCEVDYSLLSLRVVAVGIAALATLTSTMLFSIAIPTAFTVVPLSVFLGIALIDDRMAENTANAKAALEYLNMAYPSKSATFRIQHNLKAAQLLIDQNGNLNKVNEQDERLLDYSDFEVFKLLVNHGADIKLLDKYGISVFQRVVEMENTAFLEYLLKSGKAKAVDFNATQQMELWKNLGSVKAGSLLKSYGFDINVKDSEGYTPLLRVVKDTSNSFRLRKKLGICAHVSTLLNCGADRFMTIEEKGVKKNAMEINTNPLIHSILHQSETP